MDIGMDNVNQSKKFLDNYKAKKRANPGPDYESAIRLPGRDMDGKAPYDHLAQNGVITYNGVEFICDRERNRLCLGDVSDKKNCLSIHLEGGGNLVVNRDNLGELAQALEMFSPKDINRIMFAVMKDKKIREMQGEIAEGKSFLIGRNSYTQEEWNEMLAKYDEAAEKIRELAEEFGEDDEEGTSDADIRIAYRKMRNYRKNRVTE